MDAAGVTLGRWVGGRSDQAQVPTCPKATPARTPARAGWLTWKTRLSGSMELLRHITHPRPGKTKPNLCPLALMEATLGRRKSLGGGGGGGEVGRVVQPCDLKGTHALLPGPGLTLSCQAPRATERLDPFDALLAHHLRSG